MMNQRWLIRFGFPLLFQLGLIVAIPAQAIYTRLTGTSVILKTIPVDPYDLLRGYSQTLRYEISQPEKLKTLTGWKTLQEQNTQTSLPQGTSLYVILQAPKENTAHEPPRTWKPIAVSKKLPVDLGKDQIAIQGEVGSAWVTYGIERYYFPEQKQEQLNRDINLARQKEKRFMVEVKVDKRGNAVPISLWIGDRNYRF